MSAVYDNWERLVAATLKREQLRRLALINSPESSFSSLPSDFSFASSTRDHVSVPDRRAQKKQEHLAQATKDMNRLKECYDRLLSAAVATAYCAYEFSESLGEMGNLILEETALNNDGNSGKVPFMLGKVQMELQNLISGYSSHIAQTLASPSESLMYELSKVEEMKNHCDGIREKYIDLMKKHGEENVLQNNKGVWFPGRLELQQTRDDYDDQANLFSFRMESLKHGQSRSFLTMLSRYYSAQLQLFKKAVRSLEAIEPHVRLLAEQQHIDYQLHGLGDDESETNDDDDEDE